MTREIINTGAVANDGTGDTLRSFATKANNNYSEIYKLLGGDSSDFVGNIKFGSNQVIFEGSSLLDGLKTVLAVINPTQLNTITFPDSSGEVIISTADQQIYNKHLYNTRLDGDIRLHGVSGTGYYHIRYDGVVDSALDITINVPDLIDSDTFVFTNHTQTLINKTFTSPVILTPRITTAVNDVNGAELIKVTATVSAVNEITLANAAASGKPTITASGSDTNITAKLVGKGTGSIEIAKVAYSSSTITASGAASTASTYIICNKSTALAISVADGTTVGEYKIFTNKGVGVATVTPANFAQGTSFALATNDGCQTVWDGSNWYLIGNQGEVTVA